MQGLDGFAPGETCRLGCIEVSAEAIKEFAAEYDPQPQHLDEHAASATPLQGLVASGWQTCAVLTRQLERQLELASMHVEIPGINEIKWLKPVRPGDVLETRMRRQSRCFCSGCRDSGGWVIAIEAVNQAGVPVLRLNSNALLACREASLAEAQRCSIHCAQRMERKPRVRRRPGGHLVRYFEEVVLGDEIALGSYDFTIDAMGCYTRVLDSALGSRDRSASAAALYQGASGWHVVAAWMRLVVDHYHAEADWLATHERPVPRLGPAVGARSISWRKPVRVGDRITFASWAEHKVNIGTSNEWGLLVAGVEGVNQNGESVVSLYPQFLLEKRPA
jgi:acyl dehydratase